MEGGEGRSEGVTAGGVPWERLRARLARVSNLQGGETGALRLKLGTHQYLCSWKTFTAGCGEQEEGDNCQCPDLEKDCVSLEFPRFPIEKKKRNHNFGVEICSKENLSNVPFYSH